MRGNGTSATAPQQILDRLVAFDTTSARSNLDLIGYVQTCLADEDIHSVLVPNAEGDKASLFATAGPSDVPGVGLSGHTDVVPANRQGWSRERFTTWGRDLRLFGRGTCVMKGFLACVLAMVPEFKRRPLRVPLHLLFSYDEEVGCTGVRPMIAELGNRLARARLVIVGEPTSMQVVDAHKGPVRFSVEVKGRAAHSSMAHLGVNAISYANWLIAELREQDRDVRFTPEFTTLQVATTTCGPGGIAQAHTADESIDVAQLDACLAFFESPRGLGENLTTTA